MEFIMQLLVIQGFNGIFMLVNRFSKYVMFIPMKSMSKATNVARFFFSHVVTFWSLPLNIVFDWDVGFTGNFWLALFKLVGTQLLTSLGFHSETDGQTKRVNSILESYLRHFVHVDQHNWLELLDAAQFSYNMHRSSRTGFSPF